MGTVFDLGRLAIGIRAGRAYGLRLVLCLGSWMEFGNGTWKDERIAITFDGTLFGCTTWTPPIASLLLHSFINYL